MIKRVNRELFLIGIKAYLWCLIVMMVKVYGTTWCGDCTLAKDVLKRRKLDYEWINIDTHNEYVELVLKINGGMRTVPTIVFDDNSVLVEPSAKILNAKIDEILNQRGL